MCMCVSLCLRVCLRGSEVACLWCLWVCGLVGMYLCVFVYICLHCMWFVDVAPRVTVGPFVPIYGDEPALQMHALPERRMLG